MENSASMPLGTFKKYNFKFYAKHTSVPNKLIFNPELNDASLRLLAALEALPETESWKTHQNVLAKMLGWGREKIQKAMANLIELGYLRRTQLRKVGQFSHFQYEFHWEPIFKGNPDLKEDDPPTYEESEENDTGDGKPVTGADGGNTGDGKPVAGEPGTTRYLDIGSSSNNLTIEPPTQELQKQRKKEEGQVGGFHNSSKEINIHQCLHEIKIQEAEKIRISKLFPDEDLVTKAVQYAKNQKDISDLTGYIISACRNPAWIKPSKEEIAKTKQQEEDEKEERLLERKQFASYVVKTLLKKFKEKAISFWNSHEYVEVKADAWVKSEKIYYSDDSFRARLEHIFRKLEMPIPELLKTIP